MSDSVALVIAQGKTFARTFRWAAKPFLYKAISAITKAAPARLTVTGHLIPSGWRVAVVSVLGMRQINAANDPPLQSEYRRATVVDANTIELNEVNASQFSTYTSGGYLQMYTPVDLTGFMVRMTIRDKVGGTALLELDSDELGGIALDNTAKTITITIDAETTAAMTWTSGVYEIEAESAGGVVSPITRGSIKVSPAEIAT